MSNSNSSGVGCFGISVGLILVFILWALLRSPDAVPFDQTPEYKLAAATLEAETTVRNKFKDPDSAKIRGSRMAMKAGNATVCGEVNAKNGFGAYTGYRRFVAVGSTAFIEGQVSKRDFRAAWNIACAG